MAIVRRPAAPQQPHAAVRRHELALATVGDAGGIGLIGIDVHFEPKVQGHADHHAAEERRSRSAAELDTRSPSSRFAFRIQRFGAIVPFSVICFQIASFLWRYVAPSLPFITTPSFMRTRLPAASV